VCENFESFGAILKFWLSFLNRNSKNDKTFQKCSDKTSCRANCLSLKVSFVKIETILLPENVITKLIHSSLRSETKKNRPLYSNGANTLFASLRTCNKNKLEWSRLYCSISVLHESHYFYTRAYHLQIIAIRWGRWTWQLLCFVSPPTDKYLYWILFFSWWPASYPRRVAKILNFVYFSNYDPKIEKSKFLKLFQITWNVRTLFKKFDRTMQMKFQ